MIDGVYEHCHINHLSPGNLMIVCIPSESLCDSVCHANTQYCFVCYIKCSWCYSFIQSCIHSVKLFTISLLLLCLFHQYYMRSNINLAYIFKLYFKKIFVSELYLSFQLSKTIVSLNISTQPVVRIRFLWCRRQSTAEWEPEPAWPEWEDLWDVVQTSYLTWTRSALDDRSALSM